LETHQARGGQHPRGSPGQSQPSDSACLDEERRAKEHLSRLDEAGPDDPGFIPAFQALRQSLLEHAQHEEREEFAQLSTPTTTG
jgi:hypothetical protein